MKKMINYSTKGQRADIGDLTIYRLLANNYTDAVGPFVFLDHITPKEHSVTMNNNGTGGHPHRGIATLSYILEGEGAHYDSVGNHTKVFSGGVQWMKSGNGIIHDETLSVDFNTGRNRTHAFQFWINLPAKNKNETSEYLAIQAAEVPQKNLSNDSGWIKVIVGKYEDLISKIPDYTLQFLYHVHINSGKKFVITFEDNIEVAAFVPTKSVIINNMVFHEGELVEFDRTAGEIVINNKLNDAVELLLFGGAPYTESMVAEGPFVMNSLAEIVEAYRDFREGKYGVINYSK